MKFKFETQSLLESFFHTVQIQFNTKIKIIRTDNGAEFEMPDFYKHNETLHKKSCVAKPQQNGWLKGNISTFSNVARVILFQASLPL